MKPLILINFKTYLKRTDGLELTKKLMQVKSSKYTLAIAPSSLIVAEVCRKISIAVFAQHLDPVGFGPHTGSLSAAEAKMLGVTGTILNHSEKKLSSKTLQKTIGLCRKLRLQTCVCASTIREVKNIAPLKPTYLAYEPVALIGGNISVTEARPEIIQEAVRTAKKISPATKVLCGAGVHSSEDLHHALSLGTEGVLLAHAIVLSKDPVKALKELIT